MFILLDDSDFAVGIGKQFSKQGETEMQTLFKREERSGFTLIELMVVVVLVIILALALVPTFKELITKAKYTEGIAAISAINTKLKVYQVEKSSLPGCVAYPDATPALPFGVSAPDPDGTTKRTHRLLNDVEESYLYTTAGSNDANCVGFSPIQTALDIGIGDYDGRYFAQSDYQISIDNGGIQHNGYQYTVAVSGSGEVGKAPIGSAYAVLTCYNTYVDEAEKMIVATFARYKPYDDAGRQMVLVGTASAGDTLDKTLIYVPLFYEFGAAAMPDSRADCKTELELRGWTMD